MAIAKAILLAIAVGYVAIALLLWLAQERLMFFPPPAPTVPPQAPPGWRIERYSLETADGVRLAGILLLPPRERPPLVIYFGGNAEEATSRAPHVHDVYGERAVLLMNYRGYGESGGSPGEKALVADAIALHDALMTRADLDTDRVALHGRSLGSGVAVALAASRPARCIILTTPFDSAREVAAGMYRWLPVSWLIRHPFDSAALAPHLRLPALMLIAEADAIIPKHHAERLAQRWGGPVERRFFPGFGHNDLDLDPAYDAAVRDFLQRYG